MRKREREKVCKVWMVDEKRKGWTNEKEGFRVWRFCSFGSSRSKKKKGESTKEKKTNKGHKPCHKQLRPSINMWQGYEIHDPDLGILVQNNHGYVWSAITWRANHISTNNAVGPLQGHRVFFGRMNSISVPCEEIKDVRKKAVRDLICADALDRTFLFLFVFAFLFTRLAWSHLSSPSPSSPHTHPPSVITHELIEVKEKGSGQQGELVSCTTQREQTHRKDSH